MKRRHTSDSTNGGGGGRRQRLHNAFRSHHNYSTYRPGIQFDSDECVWSLVVEVLEIIETA